MPSGVGAASGVVAKSGGTLFPLATAGVVTTVVLGAVAVLATGEFNGAPTGISHLCLGCP